MQLFPPGYVSGSPILSLQERAVLYLTPAWRISAFTLQVFYLQVSTLWEGPRTIWKIRWDCTRLLNGHCIFPGVFGVWSKRCLCWRAWYQISARCPSNLICLWICFLEAWRNFLGKTRGLRPCADWVSHLPDETRQLSDLLCEDKLSAAVRPVAAIGNGRVWGLGMNRIPLKEKIGDIPNLRTPSSLASCKKPS